MLYKVLDIPEKVPCLYKDTGMRSLSRRLVNPKRLHKNTYASPRARGFLSAFIARYLSQCYLFSHAIKIDAFITITSGTEVEYRHFLSWLVSLSIDNRTSRFINKNMNTNGDLLHQYESPTISTNHALFVYRVNSSLFRYLNPRNLNVYSQYK